jgi:hypothetical protein
LVHPLATTVMINAPIKAPNTEPFPARLAPPMTTAAMISNPMPLAVVGRVRARQGLHQGAFARAIFAHQRQHFAGVDVKVHAVQR